MKYKNILTVESLNHAKKAKRAEFGMKRCPCFFFCSGLFVLHLSLPLNSSADTIHCLTLTLTIPLFISGSFHWYNCFSTTLIMSLTIGEIFDEYVDSKNLLTHRSCWLALSLILTTLFIGLANLPSEVDQNMQELRSMDEEFQRKAHTHISFLYVIITTPSHSVLLLDRTTGYLR